MNCNDFPIIPNPVMICQKVYGLKNINEVKDAMTHSMRRFYGPMCDFNDFNNPNNIYDIIQTYIVKIIKDAGRNPKAIKLQLPPSILEPSIFPKYYIDTNYNKELSLKLSIEECNRYPIGLSDKYLLHCYIDYHSV
jgi:hypothetical protein